MRVHWVLASACLLACPGPTPPDAGPPADAGDDAGSDGGVDDAGSDGGVDDAGSDGGVDAGPACSAWRTSTRPGDGGELVFGDDVTAFAAARGLVAFVGDAGVLTVWRAATGRDRVVSAGLWPTAPLGDQLVVTLPCPSPPPWARSCTAVQPLDVEQCALVGPAALSVAGPTPTATRTVAEVALCTPHAFAWTVSWLNTVTLSISGGPSPAVAARINQQLSCDDGRLVWFSVDAAGGPPPSWINWQAFDGGFQRRTFGAAAPHSLVSSATWTAWTEDVPDGGSLYAVGLDALTDGGAEQVLQPLATVSVVAGSLDLEGSRLSWRERRGPLVAVVVTDLADGGRAELLVAPATTHRLLGEGVVTLSAGRLTWAPLQLR